MKLKQMVIAALALVANVVVQAEPISLEQARTAARRWVRNAEFVNGALLGSDVSEVRAVTDSYGDTLFYVAKFEAGGFVVVSPDDRMLPVLAFSESEDLEETEENPFYSLLCADVTSRLSALEAYDVAFEKAGGAPGGASGGSEDDDGNYVPSTGELIAEAQSLWLNLTDSSEPSEGNIEKAGAGQYLEIEKAGAGRPPNVMVEPIVKSTWDQATVESYADRERFYNYYVYKRLGEPPDSAKKKKMSWPCGCVATAFAQVMYKHQWPKTSLPAKDMTAEVNGVPRTFTTIAGKLDWANMPAKPSKNFTIAQRNAVATLTYNVAIAAGMDFTQSAGYAHQNVAGNALVSFFGYASARNVSGTNLEKSCLENGVLANLEHGAPVVLSLYNSTGGHCVIADGYGYSGGKPYVHLNLGWSHGGENDWYLLPTVNTGSHSYNLFEVLTYNIFPQETGFIICGKVTKGGSAVSGATVTAIGGNGTTAASSKTNGKGMYTLVVPGNATYVVKAVSGKASGERKNVSISVTYSGVPNKWGQDIAIAEQTVKSYTVTFDANGGEGKMAAQTFANGTGQLKKCSYWKDNAEFKGWAKTRGGTVVHEDEDWIALSSDVTLFAVWEDVYAPPPSLLTVTFLPNGASGSAYTQEFEEGQAQSLVPCQFGREGFDFLGWSRSADGDVAYYDGDWIAVLSDIRLYAVWEERHDSNVEWTISGDGRLTAVELNGDTEVTIPSSVKTIGRTAFNQLAGVVKVVMPSSVTKIEAYAFSGCAELKEVVFGDGLVEIGNGAFSACTALESVNVPGSVTRLGERVFAGCWFLTSATFGLGVTQVPNETFMYCGELSSVSLPGSIRRIGDYAFDSCESLKTLSVPASVTDISPTAFCGAGIETFDANTSGEGAYSKVGSALVAMDSLTLVAVPAGETDYEVPAECMAVGPYAFSMCPGLKSVKIGSRVTTISADAFVGCRELEVAILPSRFEGSLPVGLFSSSPDVRILYMDEYDRPITISFDANGGEGEMAPITAIAGRSVRIPACMFADFWNEFAGWSLDPSGIAVYSDKDVVVFANDVTLYALWERKHPRTIRYFPFPGDTSSQFEMYTPVGEHTSISECLIEKSGYRYLVGWSLTPDGEVAYAVGQRLMPLTDMTLYGVWGKAQGPTFEIEDGVLRKAYTDGGWNASGEIPESKVREFSIPTSVTNIAEYAFRTDCDWSIGKVKIPSSVRTVSEHAFWNCGLTELVVEGGEVEICDYAFRDCAALKKVTIGDGVVTIGEDAFWCCQSLNTVTIGDGVAVIGDCAFRDCDRLEAIRAGDCNIFVHEAAFYLSVDDWDDWISTSGSLDVVSDMSSIARSVVSFEANGGEGFMAPRTFFGEAELRLPSCTFRRSGFRFAGWQTPTGSRIANNGMFSATHDTVLSAVWEPYDGLARFADTALSAPEGGKFIVTISGGSETSAAKVKLQLTHQTSSAADLDLGKAKFPLTVEWANGEVCDKTVVIPVKADKTPENDETFVLQLSDADGMGVADGQTLYATITDPVAEALAAKVASGSATKSETATLAKLMDAGAPLFALAEPIEGGTVKGSGRYANGKSATLSAKAAKGWAFAGWYDAGGQPLVGSVDWRQNTFPFIVDGLASQVIARFVPDSEDGDISLSLGSELSTYRDGAFDFTLPVDSVSFPKVTVKGLPAGLKFDAKALRLYGKATKPGVYSIEVAAVNLTSKQTAYGLIRLTVPNFTSTVLPGLKRATDAYGLVWSGVAFAADRIDCTPADGWTVKVTGLPAGLKFDAKTGRITGVPTAKAGAYTVTFTASKKGEMNQSATITLNVESLPTWVSGTFNGEVGNWERGIRLRRGFRRRASFGGQVGGQAGNGESASAEASAAALALADKSADKQGTVSLAVATSGKISGKILEGGKTWTLSASSFDAVEGLESEVGSPVFLATVVGKAGKETVTNEVTVSAENGIGVATSQLFNLSTFQPFNFKWTAWQNLWKRADTKASQPVFKKSIVVEYGDPGDRENMVKITFKTGGVVSFSGKVGGVSVSGSSQLVCGESGWQVTLYTPQKKGFDGWCETFPVKLTMDEQNIVTKVELGGEEPEMVQLWEGGPYWATKNIGAEKPEDSGYYFWWGDTLCAYRVSN